MHLANFPLDCDLNSGEIVKYDVFTKLDKEEKDRLKKRYKLFWIDQRCKFKWSLHTSI